MKSGVLQFIFGIIALTQFINGQSYSHSPNDTLSAISTLDAQVTMSITQVHPTNDTLNFVWNKLSVSLPMEWEASICDNSSCFTSLIESNQSLPVLPGDNGIMLIHCTPHTNTGTGIIRYTIYETSSPQTVDTLTWIVNVTELGITNIDLSRFDFFVFENNLHFINDSRFPKSFSILEMSGKSVFNSGEINTKTCALPSLPHSFYFLKLSDENNHTTHQKIWL